MNTAAGFILLTLSTLTLMSVYTETNVSFFSISQVFAETTVNVTTNTNSKSTSTSTVKSNTDIKITTNGETKEFHSDGTSDIEYTSEDGKTRVSVKNNTVTNNKENMQEPTAVTGKPQPTPTEVEENTEEEEVEDTQVRDNRPFPSSIIERFKSILNGIASKMFNLFSPNK